jgi:Spy/CpxP family protein refolding chaperone
MDELKPVRDQLRGLRQQGMQLLAATVIDRAALERLRAARLQLEDTRSRRMLQALTDAADVLTPEQRLKVAEIFRNRHGGRR